MNDITVNDITANNLQHLRLAREMTHSLRLERWQGAYDVALKLAREGKIKKWWDEKSSETG